MIHFGCRLQDVRGCFRRSRSRCRSRSFRSRKLRLDCLNWLLELNWLFGKRDGQRSGTGQKIGNGLENRFEHRNSPGCRVYDDLHDTRCHAVGDFNKGNRNSGDRSRRNQLVHHGDGGDEVVRKSGNLGYHRLQQPGGCRGAGWGTQRSQ